MSEVWSGGTPSDCSESDLKYVEQSFFQDYRQHLQKLCTLDFGRIIWFNFGKGEKVIAGKITMVDHPMEVWVRRTYNVMETQKPLFLLQEEREAGYRHKASTIVQTIFHSPKEA